MLCLLIACYHIWHMLLSQVGWHMLCCLSAYAMQQQACTKSTVSAYALFFSFVLSLTRPTHYYHARHAHALSNTHHTMQEVECSFETEEQIFRPLATACHQPVLFFIGIVKKSPGRARRLGHALSHYAVSFSCAFFLPSIFTATKWEWNETNEMEWNETKWNE